MHKSLRSGFFLSLLIFAACALVSDNNVELIQSPSDTRDYQYIELSNQLKVLLISDPAADKAAASLDVYVGSRQDPDDYLGLAHFLEHMLFLGTQAYPDSGEYQQFISTHNGAHNAYTSFEHTNYFFDIDPDYLDEALSRFSQFFVAPLFTEDYVDREKNAVHSEFMAKLKDDPRRALDVFKTTINPQHPFSKFSVGNLDTLNNDQGSLRRQLVAFYQKNYSANIMSLVVMGREPLHELRNMVVPKFSEVADRHKSLDPIDEPLYEPGVLPIKIAIKPEREQRLLSIGFTTAATDPYYQQKPLQYIGNIIGHEGEGSLLSYLKAKGWAEGLGAGTGLSYQGGASFQVSIQLTEQGVSHSDEITLALFQTIARIRTEGIKSWMFDEQKAIGEQHFRYQEKTTPIAYVSMLSNMMHYYPAAEILYAPYEMKDYDPALLAYFLDFLRPEKAFITLNAPEAKTDKRTALYDAPYSVSAIDQKTVASWQAATVNPQITLPVMNEFIADDLTLKAVDQSSTALPVVEIDRPGLKLWYQRDEQFSLPKGNLIFSLYSPMAKDTPEHAALLVLYTRMISEQLNEFSYPAYLAGLNYSLSVGETGLMVKIGGFTDKQELLLDKVLDALLNPQWNVQRFERLKTELVRQAENADKQQPYRRLMAVLPEFLYKNYWSEQQRLAAYRGMTLEQFKHFHQQFITSVQVQGLVYGNYSRADAALLGGKMQLTEQQHNPDIEVLKLSVDQWAYHLDSDYTDAVIAFYLQASNIDKSARAAMGVTAQVLRADFFNDLRTEKQLGYVVASGAYPVREVPGLFFLVQSPVMGPTALQNEIKEFIRRRTASLEQLSLDDYERHRGVLIQKLAEQPRNLGEQTGRYWSDLTQGYTQFDSREQLITALQALSFEQWKVFFKTEVAASDSRGLWLYSRGKFVDEPPIEAAIIENAERFKQKQRYYQFQ